MVKPTKKKLVAKVNEIERRLEAGAPLDIVVIQTGLQPARVGWGAGGLFIAMPPEQARKMAADFAAKIGCAVGADDIGRDLMEAADVCDMHNSKRGPRQ